MSRNREYLYIGIEVESLNLRLAPTQKYHT